jgi:hypothetical protein
MTNPNQAMRMLITYAIIIPVAIIVGYLAQDIGNYQDRSNIGFLALLLAVLVSPFFIKFHHPFLIFGLVCPAFCFFLPGDPPLGQVAVILSLVIAIVERTLSSERRFISVPVMFWPLLFLAAMAYMTAQMTGGINLHTMGGGDTGGGRKYITLFLGVGTFFALTSRAIPKERRNFYIGLYFLIPLLGIIRDMSPVLPKPFNVINLLFPPTAGSTLDVADVAIGTTRLVSLGYAVGTITVFLLVKYGLGGVMNPQHPIRALLFIGSFLGSLLGGFRNQFAGFMLTLGLLFLLERLYRTRLVMVFILGGALAILGLATFSNHLPYTFQRAMSFLPFKWDAAPVMDAQGTAEWRFKIWRDTWPKVPQYLLLGKGYALSKEDFDMIGQGQFTQFQSSHIDASSEALAISSDFHSGPLSTLIPFGMWGAIGMLWLMGAALYVTHRNFKYGDPEIKTFNTFMFVSCIGSVIQFLFIFGGFDDDVANFAKLVGFSVAINGGVCKPVPKPAYNPVIKPPKELPLPEPQTAPAGA